MAAHNTITLISGETTPTNVVLASLPAAEAASPSVCFIHQTTNPIKEGNPGLIILVAGDATPVQVIMGMPSPPYSVTQPIVVLCPTVIFAAVVSPEEPTILREDYITRKRRRSWS